MKYILLPVATLVALGLVADLNPASAAIELNAFVSQSFNGPTPVQARLYDNDANSGQGRTYGSGGEYRVVGYNGATSAWESIVYTPVDSTLNKNTISGDFIWKTFCVEYNEFFNVGQTYNVTLDDAAYYGSNLRPGSTAPEALLDATKLLYGLYFEGRLDTALVGFNYFDSNWADALQQAIWNLEDTTTFASSKVNAILNFANANAGNLASYGLQGEVKVLNLWNGERYSTSTAAQSHLAYVPGSSPPPPPPPPPPAVPEPTTLAVWSVLAGMGLVVSRRRRTKR